VARNRHRWAEAPGESLGPQALAQAARDSRHPPTPGPAIPHALGHPATETHVRVQVGLPHIAHWLGSTGCLSCPWSPGN
jgi:hypothetical protein